jgi:hypothetical protein
MDEDEKVEEGADDEDTDEAALEVNVDESTDVGEALA